LASHVRADLENLGEFSFSQMLKTFVHCVSPRTLDGLVANSRHNSQFINAQIQPLDCAIERLVNKTELEDEGWTRVLPLKKLFEKYKADPNIKLERIKVFAQARDGEMTYKEALRKQMIISVQIRNNTLSSTEDTTSHATTIFEIKNNIFQIKNSYNSQKTIQIDSAVPTSSIFESCPDEYRKAVNKVKHFSNENFIIDDLGFCLMFRDK